MISKKCILLVSVCVSLVIALVIVTNKSDLNNDKERSRDIKTEPVKTCMTEGCIGRLHLYNHNTVQSD